MSEKPSESQRKRLKKEILKIADKLGLTLTNPDKVYSNRDYNKYIFSYDSLFGGKMSILIETSYYLTVYPVSNQSIHSILLDYYKELGIRLPDIITIPEFTMQVQDIKRTFIDKLFALCDYRLKNLQERNSRHLYDLYKLMPYITFDNNFVSLINRVRADRMTTKNNISAQPEYDITAMLQEIIDIEFFKDDYNKITTALLYEKVSYEQVRQNLQAIIDMNLFENIKDTDMEYELD